VPRLLEYNPGAGVLEIRQASRHNCPGALKSIPEAFKPLLNTGLEEAVELAARTYKALHLESGEIKG